ncbi:hypothetical protein QE152_g1867 [Popillia japonica]|uniref:Uncharacterized protein n=1 Tax=Popillia japonica TaxID=7064 RepID=A0AAW1N4C8_POPJA
MSRNSFSDIVKKNSEVIVVKPINMKQKCQETKKEVKTKIDPVKLAVGVETITNIRQGGVAIGGVAIACSSNESKEKLKNVMKKELGNTYQVAESKIKNPKIIIVGVETD